MLDGEEEEAKTPEEEEEEVGEVAEWDETAERNESAVGDGDGDGEKRCPCALGE